MIARLFRALSFLRILREDRQRYADLLRGGAIGDSDMREASAGDADAVVVRCSGKKHVAPGLFGCANCGAEWSGT